MCMQLEKEFQMSPTDAMVAEKCIVCGHKCHCGTTCEAPGSGCVCGVCTHEVDEVEDYININPEG